MAQLAWWFGNEPTLDEHSTISKKRDEFLDLLWKFKMEAKGYLSTDAYTQISRYILEQTDDIDENGDEIALGTIPTLNTPAKAWPELLVVPMASILPCTSPTALSWLD